MRNLFIKFSRLVMYLSLVFLLFSCTQIYLVRHAERLDGSPDSPLSTAGFKRTGALRDALLNKHIDSVYVTTLIRTQQTADSLCLALGINYKKYNYTVNAGEQLVQRLKLLNYKHFLVVGHSNTIPPMVKTITNQTVSVPDNVFNKMFVVTIRRWPTTKIMLEETTYGAPSPP